MPKDSGIGILGYEGSADLGSAEDTAIPVVAKDQELSNVNKTAQELRLIDHQNNLTLYNQKIQDRDKLLKLFEEGQVESGKILPGDKHYYDELETKHNEAYKAIKGMDDRQGISNYLKVNTELHDMVTNLQHRWTEITKLEAEKATQKLPKDIQSYTDHIAKQIAKKPGELIDPYQKAFSGDFDAMATAIKGSQIITSGGGGTLPTLTQQGQTITTKDAKGNIVKSVTKTAPVAGKKTGTPTKIGTAASNIEPAGAYDPKTDTWDPALYSPEQLQQQQRTSGTPEGYIQATPEMYYDLPTMIKRAEQLYLGDNEQAENQRQWFQLFYKSPEWTQKDLITRDNERIRQYLVERGIDPNSKEGKDSLIQFHLEDQNNPNSRIVLTEQTPTFAAKHTLASIEGNYVQKPTYTWDKTKNDWLLKQIATNANALASRAHARLYQTQAYRIASQIKDEKQQDKVFDDVYSRTITAQPNLVTSDKGNSFMTIANIPAAHLLPLTTFAPDSKGIIRPSIVYPLGVTKNKDGTYSGEGYYDPSYTYNGRAMSATTMWNMYDKFKKDMGKKWDGSFNDYLHSAISTRDGQPPVLELTLTGQTLSGQKISTDRAYSRESLKALSNAWQKKFQDSPFDLNAALSDPEVVGSATESTTTTTNSNDR